MEKRLCNSISAVPAVSSITTDASMMTVFRSVLMTICYYMLLPSFVCMHIERLICFLPSLSHSVLGAFC